LPRAAWSRADLVHCIGLCVPDQAVVQEQAHQILESLTGWAAGSARESRCCAQTRRSGRANGQNVYQARGAEPERGAKWGANACRRPAIQSDAERISVQVNGSSGYFQRCRATVRLCLLSSWSQVRSLPGAQDI